MISNLEPTTQRFLNNLNRVAARMDKAQQHITTGVRVTSVSDEPDHVGTLLSARQHLEAAKQIEDNLGRVKAEVDGAETGLRTATEFMDRIRTLGAQGASDTATAQARQALAGEVGSLMEQLVGISNTVIEGRFIFSGNSDHTPPYAIDLTQATPISLYQGTAATRNAQHPNGTTFSIAHTAQQIFDSATPADNVFAAVSALRTALLANDGDAIRRAFENLTPAAAHLQSELSYYGTTQNKLADAVEFGEQLQLGLKAQISSLEDADLTEAILELQQSKTQQEASLNSWAQIPRRSLFDYLG